MTKRFKDVYRAWMDAKHLTHIEAGARLGISRATSFHLLAGVTPPLSKVPLYADRMGLKEPWLRKLITRERANMRKSAL